MMQCVHPTVVETKARVQNLSAMLASVRPAPSRARPSSLMLLKATPILAQVQAFGQQQSKSILLVLGLTFSAKFSRSDSQVLGIWQNF